MAHLGKASVIWGLFLRAGKVRMTTHPRKLVSRQMRSHANAPTTERRSREVRGQGRSQSLQAKENMKTKNNDGKCFILIVYY